MPKIMGDFGTIRRADYFDLDQIVEIEKKCYDGDLAYTRKQLNYLLKSANSRCLVESKEDILRGFVLVLFRRGTNVAGIEILNVDPCHRGCGIGKRLLQAAEQDIFSNGVKKIRLEVSMGNTCAIKLYEKSGFRKIAILPNYYYYEHYGTHDALRMVKQLTT